MNVNAAIRIAAIIGAFAAIVAAFIIWYMNVNAAIRIAAIIGAFATIVAAFITSGVKIAIGRRFTVLLVLMILASGSVVVVVYLSDSTRDDTPLVEPTVSPSPRPGSYSIQIRVPRLNQQVHKTLMARTQSVVLKKGLLLTRDSGERVLVISAEVDNSTERQGLIAAIVRLDAELLQGAIILAEHTVQQNGVGMNLDQAILQAADEGIEKLLRVVFARAGLLINVGAIYACLRPPCCSLGVLTTRV